MSVSCKVSGDALVVTRDEATLRMALAVPIDRLEVWLEIDQDAPFWNVHQTIRDDVMPDEARDQLATIESVDAVDAVQVTAEWSRAIGVRLGKALSVSSSGVIIEQPSPETSGSDTESSSTE